MLERRWNARNAIQEFQLQIAFAKPYYNCLLKKQGTLSFAIRLSWRQVTVAIRQFLTKRNAIYTLPVALSPTRTASVIPTPRPQKGVWWTTALKVCLFLFFLLLRSLTTWGIEPGSAQHIIYSLYQLLLSNTIRSKTTLLASSQMVSCQDIFSPLREPQNGTRSAFNPEKGTSIIQRLNYRGVSVRIGVRFQTKRCMFLFPAALMSSLCLNYVPVAWSKAARDA